MMTSPAITLSSDKTVMGNLCFHLTFSSLFMYDFYNKLSNSTCLTSTDAAVLMLKMKIHRLPVVNQDEQVIGEYQNVDKTEIKKNCMYILDLYYP